MKIGLVLDPYGAPSPGSAGAFVPMIAALIENRPADEFTCYVRQEYVEVTVRAYPRARVLPLRKPVWLFGGAGLDPSLDAYLFTTPVIPLFFAPKRSVVFAQDFAYLESAPRSLREGLERVAVRLVHARSLRIATTVAAISASTKAAIIRHFGIPPEKVTVVHIGYRAPAAPLKSATAPARFFLFAGVLKPRKNVMRIIEGFAAARKEHPDVFLLIAGKTGGSYYQALVARITELGLQDVVRFLGFVPDEELSALYARATAFVFPSLVEGFGMPILEAMAAGAPVITSEDGACAEVAGDAALLVDPRDTADIASAMTRLLANEPLRASLRERGMTRIKDFSWESAAAALSRLLVYTP